jgi:hypothetical protein
MAVWFRPPPGETLASGQSGRGSERPVLISGVAFEGITASPLVFERLAQLIAMERQDLIPDIIDQFEHGESLLRRPEAGVSALMRIDPSMLNETDPPSKPVMSEAD